MFTVLIGYRSNSGSKHVLSIHVVDIRMACDELEYVFRVGIQTHDLNIPAKDILYVTIDRSNSEDNE